jgi:hypothetical protein
LAGNSTGNSFGTGADSAILETIDAVIPGACGKFPAVAAQGIFSRGAGNFPRQAAMGLPQAGGMCYCFGLNELGLSGSARLWTARRLIWGLPDNTNSPLGYQMRVPLTITVTTSSGIYRYGEEVAGTEPYMVDSAIAKTRAALRADILQGVLPRESKMRLQRGKDAKPYIFEGSLYECARQYPDLLELYNPIRRNAISGMKYGILFGIAVHLLLLGYTMLNTDLFGRDPTFGLAVIFIPICGFIAYLHIKHKLKIPIVGVASMLGGLFLEDIWA